jgi:hypothetical protein
MLQNPTLYLKCLNVFKKFFIVKEDFLKRIFWLEKEKNIVIFI